MKCGDHALIRDATPAGLEGTLGTRSKRAARDSFVPGDDPDLTYGAELVKVRCALSLHLPLLCQSVGEREGEGPGERILSHYNALRDSLVKRAGERASAAATNITWHPGKRPRPRQRTELSLGLSRAVCDVLLWSCGVFAEFGFVQCADSLCFPCMTGWA